MRYLLVVVLALRATVAFAGDEKLPSWLPNPQLFDARDTVYYESYSPDELKVWNGKAHGDFDRVNITGHHWTARVFDVSKQDQPWHLAESLEALLVKQGFKTVYRSDDKAEVDMRKGDGDHATWVRVETFAHDGYLHIVEVAPLDIKITAPPPTGTPKLYGEKEPIPYLPPIAGATLDSGRNEPGPLDVQVDHGKDKPSEHFPVGTTVMMRHFIGPHGLSSVALVAAYAKGLAAAGWTITSTKPDENVYAHYDKNGRDIWVYIVGVGKPNQTWSMNVVDVGGGLRAELQKGCKAALYGVNFDFDKATLRRDSDPALNQVLGLLKDDAKLAVEIGGHTDNVGKPDYNLKLSDERAASVRQWLVAHGIAASRLSSRGYGDTEPLVPNNSDDNRAKNRRVEIKKAGCK